MNKDRRRRIQVLIDSLELMKSHLEEIREEEQSAFDNMPESFQDGEKGDRMQDIIGSLESVEDNFTEAMDSLIEAIE